MNAQRVRRNCRVHRRLDYTSNGNQMIRKIYGVELMTKLQSFAMRKTETKLIGEFEGHINEQWMEIPGESDS